ncbi:MAG: dTMP kinase [Magnetococcus sp. WYHC-3]
MSHDVAVAPAGRFITLEGGEGVGKSTQVRALAQWLGQRGIDALVTREPGGCAVAEGIRTLLVSGAPGDLSPEGELLLVLAARLEHVRRVIQPALAAGRWVLCDRFVDSTRCYQGHAGAVPLSRIDALHQEFLGDFAPHRTLILDLDPRLGLARSRGVEQGESRFEERGLAFHQVVRQGFLAIARADTRRVRVVDAHGSPQEVLLALAGALEGLDERIG